MRGTHIIRKMATTRARRCGSSKYKANTRARLKQRRYQYSYAQKIHLWPDSKVAADLCKGGPTHYQVRADSGISENWILRFVVTTIASKYC